MPKTKWIYLVGATGIAKVSPESVALSFEKDGWRRCSYREWLQTKIKLGRDPLVIKMSGKVTLSVESE